MTAKDLSGRRAPFSIAFMWAGVGNRPRSAKTCCLMTITKATITTPSGKQFDTIDALRGAIDNQQEAPMQIAVTGKVDGIHTDVELGDDVTCVVDADVASHNLSKAADQFQVLRRIVFYNGITGEYMHYKVIFKPETILPDIDKS